MESKFINIKDAAKMLGVSKLTLRNWDKSGKLTALRHPINNYRVYLLENIEKILKQIESNEKTPHKTKIEPENRKFFKAKVIHMSD